MSGVTLLFGAAFLGAILYLTQFNQQVFGVTASQAGYMLLPMMGGMVLSSVGVGQIISRVGKYKRFIVIGITITTVSILSLVTLNPDSPYWHEAVTMAITGLGLGMAMPILSLAVQNEFEQKDLGAATSSVQLFRGLGSTLGTALLSGMLTTGIIASISAPAEIPYIQTLRQSPGAPALVTGNLDANTLLQINTQKQPILDGATTGINRSSAPASVKREQIKSFTTKQNDFNTKVVDAFTASLHKIFFVSAGLMALALILVLAIREKPLRNTIEMTPAEE